MKRLSLTLTIALLLALLGCGGASGPDTSRAKPYSVIDTKKTHSRARVTCSILAPEAKSYEEFAQTAMKAAMDAQKKTNAKVVVIELEEAPRTVGKGVLLAMAFYAPDGGGFSGDQGWTWDVKAVKSRHSDAILRMTTLWYNNRNDFQVPDNYGGTQTDEVALKAFIGKTMGIDPETVTLAFASWEQYQKK